MPYYMLKYEGVAEVIEAESQAEADKEGYEIWRDWIESQADWFTKPLTSEDCEDEGLDPEDYGLEPVQYDD